MRLMKYCIVIYKKNVLYRVEGSVTRSLNDRPLSTRQFRDEQYLV